MTFKDKNQSHQFTYANLNQVYDSFFQAIAEATQNNELSILYTLTHMETNGINLTEGHLELLHRHYKLVSQTLESQFLKKHAENLC